MTSQPDLSDCGRLQKPFSGAMSRLRIFIRCRANTQEARLNRWIEKSTCRNRSRDLLGDPIRNVGGMAKMSLLFCFVVLVGCSPELSPTREINNVFDEASRRPIPQGIRAEVNQETIDLLQRDYPIGSNPASLVSDIESTGGNCEPDLDQSQTSQVLTCLYENSTYHYYRSVPIEYSFVFYVNNITWRVVVAVRSGRIAEYDVESHRQVSTISEEQFNRLRSAQLRNIR